MRQKPSKRKPKDRRSWGASAAILGEKHAVDEVLNLIEKHRQKGTITDQNIVAGRAEKLQEVFERHRRNLIPDQHEGDTDNDSASHDDDEENP